MEKLWDYPFAENILEYLDVDDFLTCHSVCSQWRDKLDDRFYVKKMFEKIQRESLGKNYNFEASKIILD